MWLESCQFIIPKLLAGGTTPEGLRYDVGALLAGYLSSLKARGGALVTGAEVTGLTRADDRWTAENRDPTELRAERENSDGGSIR